MRWVWVALFLFGCGKSEDAMMDQIANLEIRANQLESRITKLQRKVLEIEAVGAAQDEEITRLRDLIHAYGDKADMAFQAIQLKLEEQQKASKGKRKPKP